MDLSADPRRDFTRYATGGWMDRTEIPGDKLLVMDASVLLASLDAALLDIARTSAAATGADKTGNVQLVGDFFSSAMDMAKLDALGTRPIQPLLAAAEAAQTPKQFAELAARLELELGANPFLNTSVSPDRKQSSVHTLFLAIDANSLGFGLTRDEYLNPDSQQIRDNYQALIARLLQLAGDEPEAAGKAAAAALAFETEIAKATMTPVQAANPNATYNKLRPAELGKLLPAMDLDSYFAALGVALPDTLIVGDPGAVKGLQKALAARSPQERRSLLRTYIVRTSAASLGGDFLAANREYKRIKSGLTQMSAREKEVTDSMGMLMAHPLSRLYVAKYFKPERRQAVVDMMDRIKNELRKRIETNDWLSEQTRQAALAKLARIRVLVGYPENDADWIDYSSVRIDPEDYFGNVSRLHAFDKQRNLRQLGQPVEVDQFTYPGRTTPISMNAAIHQGFLVVYVTAAFIQPPYYVDSNDAAANFGSLGAVVGHELTHAFDSTGRNYDINGELHDWWSPADAAEFQRRAKMLVDQYNAYEPAPGVKVNGEFNLAENIADLGGLTLAYNALQQYMSEQGRLPDLDGITPEQRLFIAWAQVWMAKTRLEGLKYAIAVDPHAPGEVRAYGPAVNMDVFYKAFDIREGDPMWKNPEDRVTIW